MSLGRYRHRRPASDLFADIRQCAAKFGGRVDSASISFAGRYLWNSDGQYVCGVVGLLSCAQTILKNVILAAVVLKLGVMTVASPGLLRAAEPLETGVVAVAKLNMRSAPDSAAPILMVLDRDARIQIVRRENDWLRIVYNNRVGYIRNRSQFIG
jgi:hypothetical protein